jgi:hypothetical protein
MTDTLEQRPRMESSRHRLLQPPTNIVYVPEDRVRRGLAAREIAIDERIVDDIGDFGSRFASDANGQRLSGPESWGEITHIGLSARGDIRMINVAEGGREVLQGDASARQFEVYVIGTGHSRYRLAVSRVMALLPGLRRGAGMVRLAPPLAAPWPFFDYDFVNSPVFFSLPQLAGGSPQPAIQPLPADSVTVTAPIHAVSWEANGDVLLAPDFERLPRPAVWRIATSHPRHASVLAELRRSLPGLRRGAGFLGVLFTAPPPWPLAPFERALDLDVARRIADGTWYVHPFAPPPPPSTAPSMGP